MCLLGFGTDMHNAQAGTATFFFNYEPNLGLFFTKQRLILCKTNFGARRSTGAIVLMTMF